MVAQEHADVDAVVVGAGFSGLYMLHRLRGLGLTVRVIESGEDVGGTWYWNRYPGARCDIESVDYCYSFSDELVQSWDWTERYPAQPDILRYIRHVADRFGLRDDIRFGRTVVSASYREDDRRWHVTCDTGETFAARFCIMATGCLSVPITPEIDGMDQFQGRLLHTARWPEEGVDLDGTRVAVIGTGSSGVQVIPQIAQSARTTTVFQRTAHYAMPAQNRPLDADRVRALKANFREYREVARWHPGGTHRVLGSQSALEVTDAERRETYERYWTMGGPDIQAAYRDLRSDLHANETAARFVRGKIREIVTDPAKADILTPRGYPFGTKRLCLEIGFYEAFNRDDVRLVDVKATPIKTMTATGIRTTERDYDFDVIVLATGFDAVTGAISRVDVTGRRGAKLRDRWADGPSAHLGLATHGFPNLFFITGPGSPSILSNVLVSIEQHVEWVADCLRFMLDGGHAAIESTRAADRAWAAEVARAAAETLYPRAESWYLGANVPGKPRVFLPYIGGVGEYRRRCNEVAETGYRGFTLS